MPHDPILPAVESFLSETGMGPSYFGKRATGNSEVVSRLRDGRRIWPETRDRIVAFMAVERHRRGSSPPEHRRSDNDRGGASSQPIKKTGVAP